MRISLNLPHLKIAKTGNAKYRRRVTSPTMQTMLGKASIEWSLKTRDPLKIVDAWNEAHAKFEALEAKANGKTTTQAEWDMLLNASISHGLVKPDTTRIGPIDAEMEQGQFRAFTNAILAEAGKLSPQQFTAKFTNNPYELSIADDACSIEVNILEVLIGATEKALATLNQIETRSS